MKKIIVLFVAIILFCTKLMAENMPFNIYISQHYNEAWNYYSPQIEIVSKADGLTIKTLTANRGNCRVGYYRGVSKNMQYGDSLKAILAKDCRLLSIKIKTNRGAWEFDVN